MDNQDKIKYKEAEAPGWFYKIDIVAGSKISFADGKGSGTGLFQEMQAWIAAGNEVEPQYTAEELEQKEADDLDQAIENQKSQCQGFLKATDYKLLSDFEFQDDVPALKILRLEWKRIIKSDQLETVPKKPF